MQTLPDPVRPIAWAHRAWVRDRLIEQTAADRPKWYPSILERLGVGANGCQPWAGVHDAYGYGIVGGPAFKVHRVVWLMERGPLALGWVPDHHCRNRECLNIEHLEAIPFADNLGRHGGGEPWRDLLKDRPVKPKKPYPVFVNGAWIRPKLIDDQWIYLTKTGARVDCWGTQPGTSWESSS